jgi:hypothetical protein
VADAGPAGPSHWNVTRFSEFEQTLEFGIPFNGYPAARERELMVQAPLVHVVDADCE